MLTLSTFVAGAQSLGLILGTLVVAVGLFLEVTDR